MINLPYANTNGCLMYVIVLVRPDVAHAVSVVKRYMVSLGKEQWNDVR